MSSCRPFLGWLVPEPEQLEQRVEREFGREREQQQRQQRQRRPPETCLKKDASPSWSSAGRLA